MEHWRICKLTRLPEVRGEVEMNSNVGSRSGSLPTQSHGPSSLCSCSNLVNQSRNALVLRGSAQTTLTASSLTGSICGRDTRVGYELYDTFPVTADRVRSGDTKARGRRITEVNICSSEVASRLLQRDINGILDHWTIYHGIAQCDPKRRMVTRCTWHRYTNGRRYCRGLRDSGRLRFAF